MIKQEHQPLLIKRLVYYAAAFLIMTVSFPPAVLADEATQGDTPPTETIQPIGDGTDDLSQSGALDEAIPGNDDGLVESPSSQQIAPDEKESPQSDPLVLDSDNKDVDKTSLLEASSDELLGTKSITILPPTTDNAVEDLSASSITTDSLLSTQVITTIDSSATSGDALVDTNIVAGNAQSGDAAAIATIFNLILTTWNLGLNGGVFNTFSLDIFGDLFGDLFLNPGQANQSQPSNTPSDVTVNQSANATIDNTITLEATSGDATVKQNMSAGSATTGNASVIANIINAINSSIISGHSFVGMLNIYGNLNGDILLPNSLIETLLASNTVGSLDTTSITNTDVLGEFNNESTIVNNLDVTASSGNATVENNLSAGSATSGNANTNVTVLNLTGRQVVGKNALLVFVNVLGTWVGIIVDAPKGTTSAALGSGITNDNTLALNSSSQQTITNNINATARSGDALVTDNMEAGDATSGNANAAVNLLNINNSQFALSDWFGILFINVFGSWTGSFGVDTAAGGKTLGEAVTPNTPLPTASTATEIIAFKFVPGNDGEYTLESSEDGVAALAEAQVLSSVTPLSEVNAKQTEKTEKKTDWLMTIIGVSVAATLLGTERVLKRRQLQQ